MSHAGGSQQSFSLTEEGRYAPSSEPPSPQTCAPPRLGRPHARASLVAAGPAVPSTETRDSSPKNAKFNWRFSAPKFGANFGGGWTRTSGVRRRGIYSPLQLPLCDTPRKKAKKSNKNLFSHQGCWRKELNPQPSDYKSGALPIELRQQKVL